MRNELKYRLKIQLSLLLMLALSSEKAMAGFDLQSLMNIIDSKKLSSMEEVLPELPEDLRSNFVLVRDSKSRQGATPENPRAILFGRDAKFIAAFNGDPGLRGHDRLEMIQFNSHEAQFEFYSLAFPIQRDSSGKAVMPVRNPTDCRSCHGASLHPNWSHYNRWPGLYGENDDFLSPPELQSLRGFLARRESHSRYRALHPLLGSDISPFSYEKRGILKFRPNLRFGALLSRLQATRIAADIQKSGKFSKYAGLFAYEIRFGGSRYAGEACESLKSESSIYGGLWTPDDARQLQMKLDQERLAISPGLAPIPANWDMISNLTPLFSSLPLTAWSMNPEFVKDPFQEYQNGNTLLRSYVMGGLADETYRTIPQLRGYASPHLRAVEDIANQRYFRTPFDLEFFKAQDRLGLELAFKSGDQAHCRILIEEIKKQWRLRE